MYKLIILDLDNTLIDFDQMEIESLKACFQKHGLPCEENRILAYKAINERLWQGLEEGLYKKSEILTLRFEKWLNHYQLNGNPKELNEDYLGQMPSFTQFIDGAKDLLDFVKGKYKLIMMTNGVQKAQERKIDHIGIRDYFDHIIISDEVGYHKPSVEIFEHMMSLIGEIKKEEMIILGDSLSSDVKGGLNFSIDTCWFNKDKKNVVHNKAKYVISDLTEFVDLLKKHQKI